MTHTILLALSAFRDRTNISVSTLTLAFCTNNPHITQLKRAVSISQRQGCCSGSLTEYHNTVWMRAEPGWKCIEHMGAQTKGFDGDNSCCL